MSYPDGADNLERRKVPIPLWMSTTQAFMAGWIAGGAGIVVAHPLDTIKTLQQSSVSLNATPPAYRIFRDVWKEYGVPGLYRGLLYPLVTYGLVNAAFFSAAEHTKSLLMHHRSQSLKRAHPEKLTYHETFLVGCAGGVAQLAFVCPTELVKIKLQAQLTTGKRLYRGPGDCTVKLFKAAGITYFTTGMLTCVLRDIYAWGAYLVIFEGARDVLQKYGFHHVPSELVGGGLAGAVTWAMATPFDVIKTRIQASEHKLGTIDCIKQLYREGGTKAFTRGMAVSSFRGIPANAVTLYGYAELMRTFARYNDRKYVFDDDA